MLLIFTLLIASFLCYAENSKADNVTTLSLEEAIEEGIKNSAQLEISDLDIEVKETELKQAERQENKYKDSGYSLGTVEGFQLDANMFSKAAEFALEEEKLKKEYIVEDIGYNVTNAYYSALKAIEYVNITEDSLKNIQRNRDIVKRKFDLGLVSKAELLMADIALNEANINLEDAKADKEMALRALNMVLNYPLNTKLKLTSTFKEEEFNPNLNEDIEKAYEKRFDMIQLKHNSELVKIDFDTNAIVYPENTFNYKYKASSVAKMESILNNSKINVEFDIRNKYDFVKSAEKQIELAKTNVEKAKEGLRMSEASYEVETGNYQQVKEAMVQVYNTELALSNAVANYNLAILDYNKAVNLGNVMQQQSK